MRAAEIKAAHDLFEHLRRRGQKVAITPESAGELARMGIRPSDHADAEVVPAPAIPPDALVVCPYFTAPLILPDNRVARCAECNSPIQHRPHVPPSAKLVCAPCCLRMVRGDA